MEIGIIGLPKSGKTTVFNALTRGRAEITAFSPATTTPNIGVAKVPDPRLKALEGIFSPKKTTPAEVRYVDVATPSKGPGKEEGLRGQLLTHLTRADALIHVLRTFKDDRVPHIDGSIDPERDITTMNLELAFSDLSILEKRLEKLETSLKAAKQHERELYLRERALLARIKDSLEQDIPLREQALNKEEMKIIESYQFLTAKPMLLVLNIGEDELARASYLEEEWRARHSSSQLEVAVLCGKLEMELAQLPDANAEEFRAAMGITELGSGRIIALSYKLLGLISFFTVVSGEVKAWTIRRGTTAPRAAGKVHSDMEKGFIRAEVIGFEDLVKCGSLAEARKRGLLRLEGKNYIVQDGDIITFLFNI